MTRIRRLLTNSGHDPPIQQVFDSSVYCRGRFDDDDDAAACCAQK